MKKDIIVFFNLLFTKIDKEKINEKKKYKTNKITNTIVASEQLQNPIENLINRTNIYPKHTYT